MPPFRGRHFSTCNLAGPRESAIPSEALRCVGHVGNCMDVIFATAHNCAVDMAVARTADGCIIGLYSGLDLPAMAERWGSQVEVISSVEAREREEAGALSAFEPVDAKRWEWLLNCLPPTNRRRMGDSESFALSEAHTQRVHLHAVRLRLRLRGEDRYFEGRKLLGTPHADLVAECRSLLA